MRTKIFGTISSVSGFATALRVYGALVVAYGAAMCLLGAVANPGSRIGDVRGTGIAVGVLVVLIGIGSVFLVRVCVWAMASGTALIGVCLISGSLMHIPLPWMLVNILIGFLGLAPLFSLFRIWRTAAKAAGSFSESADRSAKGGTPPS